MGLDKKARLERVLRGIGMHLSAIDVQLLPPDQPWRLSLFHNLVKEATKNLHAIPCADACEAGMIG